MVNDERLGLVVLRTAHQRKRWSRSLAPSRVQSCKVVNSTWSGANGTGSLEGERIKAMTCRRDNVRTSLSPATVLLNL